MSNKNFDPAWGMRTLSDKIRKVIDYNGGSMELLDFYFWLKGLGYFPRDVIDNQRQLNFRVGVDNKVRRAKR